MKPRNPSAARAASNDDQTADSGVEALCLLATILGERLDPAAANVQGNSNGNTILADSSFTRSDGDIAGVALRFASGPAGNANLAAQSQQLISAMAGFAAPDLAVCRCGPIHSAHNPSGTDVRTEEAVLLFLYK